MKAHILNHIFFTLIFFGIVVSCSTRNSVAVEDSVENSPGRNVVSSQIIHLSDSLIQHRGSDTVRFGQLMSGEKVVRQLTLENRGNTPFVITGINKTCGCVDISYPKSPIKSGETSEIEVSFDSKGLHGWVFKTVGIMTSASSKQYTLVVIAEVE